MNAQEKYDKETYQYIIDSIKFQMEHMQDEHSEPRTFDHHKLMAIHVIFKFFIIIDFQFQDITDKFLSMIFSAEVIIIFVIMDFWLTKNAIGPGLIGYHWYFGEDVYGSARLIYEARINDQYTNQVYKFLFWAIQLLYIIFSYFDVTSIFIIQQSLYDVTLVKVIVTLSKLAGAVSNFFLYFKVSSDFHQKKNTLIQKYGLQFVQQLRSNSMIVYF